MIVVGIVNVTPDSFSDGGAHADAKSAVAHARRLVEEGADMLDVGGESTRPGAIDVPPDVEAERVVPVIRGLREAGVSLPVSVDTRKSSVADAALRAGATWVNDVSAGTFDPKVLETAARHGAGVILMHMRGDPRTMQKDPRYEDVVREVVDHLEARARAAEGAGVPGDRIWVDPGLGFGKTLGHNVALLSSLERIVAAGRLVLVGASRKSFLATLTGRPVDQRPVDQRLSASLACVARAFAAGAHAVRVHDVAATVDLVRTLARISPGPTSPTPQGSTEPGRR